jgi:hypothetical protein
LAHRVICRLSAFGELRLRQGWASVGVESEFSGSGTV